MKVEPTIVHICAYYPPHLGGLERVAKEVAEHLARDGYRTAVLTSDIGADGAQEPAIKNLTVKRLWSFEFAHTAFIPSLFWHLLRLPKPAIFHLHLAHAFIPEMVWLASKLRGIPYVVHFHLDVAPSGKLGFIFLWWKRWIQPIIIGGAAQVIALSPDQGKLIRERYGKPASQVVSISNGVGGRYLEIGKRERTFHQPLRLLSVGRLSVQKRPERIIEALSSVHTPVTLTMVGDGEGLSKLKKLVANRGLKNVTFRGGLLGEELVNAYKENDVFLISSDKEGMPLTILEAMATGLPVIGSNVLGIYELLEGVGVLVSNPSAETFAVAIDTLARDPARLKELSYKSYVKATENSWDVVMQRIKKMYQIVLP